MGCQIREFRYDPPSVHTGGVSRESAVVREMSRRIQNKGEVPFCGILPTVSVALFKGLGFVEEDELYYRLKHDYH